ncbi:probable WRKY transcription factor 38 [Dioscorea cayenensis subsp. rotundata]|uniref:Probable WRKY transcription factor 38 n=1 Tax=Dioscorea cayennensis subsp. rotundata TaxID=55577 RepID=A0AB40AJ24_DIOCR|nr:probable WRKY transcription factor 38 [Dioscorea cayenensis subsp. rotundata]
MMMGAMEKPLIMANNAFGETEMAIQEITRGYQLTKQIQSMVSKLGGEPAPLQLPGVLFDEVLQALTMALTNLKSTTSSSVCLISDDHRTNTSIEIKSGSRKRRKVIPWTKVTYAPHDDGYQWRKYGQKNIQKSKSSRSYYRCTYKDEGCRATKHVEEKDCNDPHLFSVTYYENHTCRANSDPIITTPEIELDQLLPKEPNLFSFESNDNMFSSLKVSGTQQSVNEQERSVDLQNIHNINDKASIESVANSEDCLGPIFEACSEGEGIPTSACLSPPWEVMSMDFLVQYSSFGYDDIFGFPCF